jgi:hypothetical protein
MKNICKLVFWFLIITLAGCAGTGSKNYDDISNKISSSNTGKVFIYRDKSHLGGAVLMKIILNGEKVAELGNGEMFSTNLVEGANSLQVSMGGLMQSDSRIVRFESDGKTPKFFITNIEMGFLSSRIKLTETLESTWKSEASGAP